MKRKTSHETKTTDPIRAAIRRAHADADAKAVKDEEENDLEDAGGDAENESGQAPEPDQAEPEPEYVSPETNTETNNPPDPVLSDIESGQNGDGGPGADGTIGTNNGGSVLDSILRRK